MHRFVGSIFKVLMISIILMFLMDASLIMIDTITVNNRVEALALIMQDELSRNNCIPDDIADLFRQELDKIVERSFLAKGWRSNMDGDIVVGGVSYDSVAESNVKDYGELLTLVIQVDMEMNSMLFVRDPSTNDGSFLKRGNVFSYTRNFVYNVPALRYLK